MKGTIVILSIFIMGVVVGRFLPSDMAHLGESMAMYTLYILMFVVGLSIGSDRSKIKMLLRPNPLFLLVPVCTVVGTLIGTALVSLLLTHRHFADCMAVGSGFGYYSLSSIIIAQTKGAELATVGLVANILRELLTIVLAPLLVMWFGPLSVISAGGATTMDTTMPFIARYAGEKFIFIAILHGILVDLSVLVLVPMFCAM